jgi:lipopolysaccharide export LptBFGC system permease protein LptF
MFGRLIGATAMVAGVIAAVQVLRKSLPLYGLVMSGAISFEQLLVVWLHVLPVVFYHATPEMASIAVAWMYYRWIENNEIVTLRNAGLSCGEIARPGLIVAVLAGLFCAVNSLLLLAPSWRAVEDIRYQALAHVGIDSLQPGYQQQVIPGVSLAFARRGRDGVTLEDVVVLDRRKEHKAIDIWAQRGGLALASQDRVLWLEHGVYLVRRDGKMERVAFETFSLPLDISLFDDRSPAIGGVYEEAFLRLLSPPDGIREDALRSAAWQTEGHRRLINPLLCCGSVVLVLGLLIPGRQARRFAGRIRFLIAVLLSLSTNILPNPVFEIASRNIELLPFLYLLPTVPGILGVLLLISENGLSLRLSGVHRDWLWRSMPSQSIAGEAA